MKNTQMIDRDKERAGRKGNTGDGDTGVPPGEQGISNRAGDTDAEADADEFEDDSDELEEQDDEEVN